MNVARSSNWWQQRITTIKSAQHVASCQECFINWNDLKSVAAFLQKARSVNECVYMQPSRNCERRMLFGLVTRRWVKLNRYSSILSAISHRSPRVLQCIRFNSYIFFFVRCNSHIMLWNCFEYVGCSSAYQALNLHDLLALDCNNHISGKLPNKMQLFRRGINSLARIFLVRTKCFYCLFLLS